MSNELIAANGVGETCYALVKNSSGQFWNGTAFETYSASNYALYDITMTEVGSTGIYLGDFPSLITSSGSYQYFVKRQAAGSPAEDDPIVNTGIIDWTGTSSIVGSSGSMTGSEWRDYVLRKGFKRTDKDTELYECTTDAVQEMRRRFGFDEAQAETITTDSISILGDYRLSLESDFGLLLGVRVEDDQNGDPLVQVSKATFDTLYPDINVTADRGYPKHFCIWNDSILIGPAPDRVSYSYRISYSQRAGTVNSATTAVPFTREYRDVLCDLVLSMLYNLMDAIDKGSFYRAEFERGWLHSVRRERVNTGQSTFMVRPYGM